MLTPLNVNPGYFLVLGEVSVSGGRGQPPIIRFETVLVKIRTPSRLLFYLIVH